MRRLAAIAMAAVMLALLASAVAGASPTGGHILHRPGFAAGPSRGLSAKSGAALTYPLSGTALDFAGKPFGSSVFWGWLDPDSSHWSGPGVLGHYGDNVPVSGDGSFSFPAARAHPGHDFLQLESDDAFMGRVGLQWMDFWHLDFSSVSSYALRPGHVNVTVAHAPAGQAASVELGDNTDLGGGLADQAHERRRGRRRSCAARHQCCGHVQ